MATIQRPGRGLIPVWLALAGALTVATLPSAAADAPKAVTHEDHVAAILKRHCLQCHGDSKQEAGLNLASLAAILKGGSGGPVVVANRSGVSRLYKVITAADPAERMPPDNDPLPEADIGIIRAWIDSGLRQNAKSAATKVESPGFTPAPTMTTNGPPPLPTGLPRIDRPSLNKPFPVLALAASPRASVAAVASYGCVDLVDPLSRKTIGTIPFTPGEPHALRFSRSGAVLLAAGGRPVETGNASLFDVRTGRKLTDLADEPDTILAADISPDERRAAFGGSSRLVKIFSTSEGKSTQTLAKHTDWVTAISYSPDGKFLATGDRNGAIHLWDGGTGGVILPLSEHKGSIRALTWRSDSKVLASCGEDGLIVWWDVAKGFPMASKPNAHPPTRLPDTYGKLSSGVLDAAFIPTGELVTSGRDRKVRIWSPDAQEGRNWALEDPKAIPTRVAVSFDGKTVIAGDTLGKVHSWAVNGPPQGR